MPYGKIHESFFNSSIVETDLETRFIFIAMIVLSDKDGRLDVTRPALARRINVPVETIDRAIEALSSPDELSRTADSDGRRIVPIDPARTWGWIVLNKTIYRHSSEEEQREQSKERKRRQREREREGSGADTPPLDSPSTDEQIPDEQISHTDVTVGHGMSRKERDTAARERQQQRESLFDERWATYPKKEGRIDARRYFLASVKNEEDLRRFDVALKNYLLKLQTEKTTREFTKNGSTFFRNWQDYVDWQPGAGAKGGAAHDFAEFELRD